MKKTITAVILILALCMSGAAFADNADNMGVQVIGGPEVEAQTVTLDDFRLKTDVEVKGYASVYGKTFTIENSLGYYGIGCNDPYTDGYYSDRHNSYESGQDAEFAILRMDVTNETMQKKNYLADCQVKVIYDGVYEFGGWCYQSDYNRHVSKYISQDCGIQNEQWAIDSEDNFAIEPMYTGHYIFGCTIPNAVVHSDKPLTMIITMEGNEITYNVR